MIFLILQFILFCLLSFVSLRTTGTYCTHKWNWSIFAHVEPSQFFLFSELAPYLDIDFKTFQLYKMHETFYVGNNEYILYYPDV